MWKAPTTLPLSGATNDLEFPRPTDDVIQRMISGLPLSPPMFVSFLAREMEIQFTSSVVLGKGMLVKDVCIHCTNEKKSLAARSRLNWRRNS